MAVQNGTNLVLKIGSKTFVGESSNSLNFTSDMIETTSKASTSGAKTYIPGETGCTISASGIYDPASANWGYSDALTALQAGTSLTFYLGGFDTGDKFYSGSCYISSLTIDNPQNDKSTWSCELQVSGVVTEKTS
jgi:predicted secreted protein